MITSRGEWDAKLGPGPAISVPTPFLHLHHSVTNPVSDSVADEKHHMRFLEHVRGFSIGVPYSFGIFGTGRIYEGQGWGRKGAHTCNNDESLCWNSTGHGFAFIGNYETTRLPDAAREAMRWLIEEGIRRGKLAKNVIIRPHNAVKATACPGKNVIPHMDYFREGGDEMTTPEEKKLLSQLENFMLGARKPFGASTPFGALGNRIGKAAKAVEGNPPHPHDGEPTDPAEPHKHAPEDVEHVHDEEGRPTGPARAP